MDELLWTTQGVVEAPVDRVADIVFEGYVDDGGDEYVKQTMDHGQRRLVQEGHWWYRGVTSVEPHEKGALVRHEVFNIAKTNRWMVKGILLQYRLNGSLPKLRTGNLGERLTEIGERLGCKAYLVDR
ncbi:hypothetical protein [Flindersiella endophytica]